jgi:hypothetical protein
MGKKSYITLNYLCFAATLLECSFHVGGGNGYVGNLVDESWNFHMDSVWTYFLFSGTLGDDMMLWYPMFMLSICIFNLIL